MDMLGENMRKQMDKKITEEKGRQDHLENKMKNIMEKRPEKKERLTGCNPGNPVSSLRHILFLLSSYGRQYVVIPFIIFYDI